MPPSAVARFPALLFDLDGTLIDSAPEIQEALSHLLEERGLEPVSVDQVKMFIGDGSARLVERGYAANGITLDTAESKAATARYIEIYTDVKPDPATIFPGVRETLDSLRQAGHVLALCTNKPQAITKAILSDFGMAGLFGAVCGGDTLGTRKPSPEPLLWALDQLGQTPANGIMVGDNANDVAAARAAGVPVVAVSYGYPRMPVAELKADLVIDRFADLPDALANLAAR